MSKPEFDIQVILPYTELYKLLEASGAAVEYAKELQRRDTQISAIRGQLIEIMDAIGAIRRELRSYHD